MNSLIRLLVVDITSATTLKPLQRIGSLLREAREKQSLTIEEIAESLKIGQEQLIALENGDEALLPEKVFVKAMIRRVSERVGIDGDSLINEIQINNLLNNKKASEGPQKTIQDQSLSSATLMKVLISLIVITASGMAITYLSSKEVKPDKIKPLPSDYLTPNEKVFLENL